MSYQIYRTNGNLLTTIPDGTANTTSTPLTLPGRSYPGYGQVFDTNFVHQLENFANNTPPTNPIQGQFWYNTTNNTLYVCPQDGITNAAQWLPVILSDVYGNVSIQNLTVLNNAFITTQVESGLFIGSGANLTNLPGANVTGTVPLATLASTANTVAGANVTGTVANASYALHAGTADVANTVAGANVTGTVSNASYALNAVTADFANSVSASNVVGNVGNAAYSTAAGYSSTAITVTANNQPNITSTGTLTSLTVTGNITAGNIIANAYGNGSGLSALTGANIIGLVANANYATTAGSLAGNSSATTAITVTGNAQPNITSVGTLSGLVVSGTINAGTISGIFTGNGSGLSALTGANVTGTVANATYANGVAGANVSGIVANATYAGTAGFATVAAVANSVAGANVTGTVANATYALNSGVASSANSVAGANVTGTVANATYALNSGVASSANSVAGANVTGTVANATFASSANTVTANIQSNITVVGTLVGLNVTGNITSGATIFANSNRVLTTADITGNLSANGWTMLPNGFIMQWGHYVGSLNEGACPTLTFPRAFPTAALNATAIIDNTGHVPSSPTGIYVSTAPNATSVTFGLNGYQSGGIYPVAGYYWTAVGY